MDTRKIKGFADIFPPESMVYSMIESTARSIFSLYMYQDIRVPIMEYTELFARGIGGATDIVQKEMFTMEDRKGRSITLRPEATAGIVRAYIERCEPSQLFKVFTMGAMFRYERPQKGRMRQFHQIDCECIGSHAPVLDAEMIAMLMHFLRALGIKDVTLLLNSLGCSECRPRYKSVLVEYLEDTCKDELCETCQSRLQTNPLRVLDCKLEQCIQVTQAAPVIADFLCGECKEHFATVQSLLQCFQIPFTLTHRLVRGLDYYVRTTFEVVSNNIGAQSSIAGGGRYDGLIQKLGGKDVPAIGFACGMERLALLMQPPVQPPIPYYIAPLCSEALLLGHTLATQLRSYGIAAECAYEVQSIKQALRYAGKYATQCILLGEDEIRNNCYSVKDLRTGEQQSYTQEAFLQHIKATV